jgi:hypothetical protein
MAITDWEPEAKGHWRWYLLGAALIVLTPILFFAFGTKPRSNMPGKDKPNEDRLESARQSLTKATDLDTCRSALTDFNAYLAKNETRRAQRLTEHQRAELRERFDLDANELAELDADTFTQLDGHYLDLCFLLHDAAEALDVEVITPKGAKRAEPLDQAEAAFGWAVRQVRVNRLEGPTLPPQFVLRRGSGTALERALVFLELLRHVGADNERMTGCLVYCPDRNGNMRLWACGVLVNDKPDIYLFDPRLGLPLPGPRGGRFATLAEARGDPTVLGQLTVEQAHPYDVTPEQAARAELQYVCSLTALAPRMLLLQDDLLKSVAKVRLAVAAEDEVKRLTTAAQAQPGTKPAVRAWRDDKASGAGVLRRFLPPEEGGVPDAKPSRRDIFTQSVMPWETMPPFFLNESAFPPNVGLGQMVRRFFLEQFTQLALEPHHARDELLRGRYNKAIQELVDIPTRCKDAEDRLAQQGNSKELVTEMNRWKEQAIEVYAEQVRAAGNPQKLEEANSKIQALWKEARGVLVVLDGTRSWPLRLEALFQLGLCKHEQAERLQHQAALNPEDPALAQRAVSAWVEAANTWQQYLDVYRAARFAHSDANSPVAAQFAADAAKKSAARAGTAPGTAARLLGRALFQTGERDNAQRTWRQDLPATELEKVGNLFLARTGVK